MTIDQVLDLLKLISASGFLLLAGRIYSVRRTSQERETIARIGADKEIALAMIDTGCLISRPSLTSDPAPSSPPRYLAIARLAKVFAAKS